MQLEERDPAYLWDMREAAREVLQFVDGLDYAGFLANRPVWLAVERELEIVGEAARRVSAAYKAAHPQVPWRAIVGQRNVLVHEYGNIDSRRVWEVATQRLPELISQLDMLIPPIPDGGETS